MATKPTISADEAKPVGAGLGLDWKVVDLEEFRRGLEVELEHGARDPETNVTNDDYSQGIRRLLHTFRQTRAEADAYWASKRAT
jgi:hypothetical protein